jgi:hypothetical protein
VRDDQRRLRTAGRGRPKGSECGAGGETVPASRSGGHAWRTIGLWKRASDDEKAGRRRWRAMVAGGREGGRYWLGGGGSIGEGWNVVVVIGLAVPGGEDGRVVVVNGGLAAPVSRMDDGV